MVSLMLQSRFGPTDFRSATGVSRETLEKLQLYCSLLLTWQRRSNLIGKSTIDDIWHRHFLDSAQLMKLCKPGSSRLVDFGSGAGFPGMVLALMGQTGVELVESSGKKCLFLEEVSMSTKTPVTISRVRFEKVPRPDPADVVTARAVAPLQQLLDDVSRWVKPDGVALLHRGSTVDVEILEAAQYWDFKVVRHPSITNPSGAILEISGIRPTNV
ncbi:MAG: 16S rRNA (guanine(527)-N(7))-methyltransferase RsmG [Rhodospirillaceae bacterium]|nr:16S rRNA (guanine(527)-N(7))-methyltransferase RsmG [Rhodospirillaceae bacterium]